MVENSVIRAAGCVLWRRSPRDGRPEIALVHRPRYDDWSHPKGKLKPGEEPLDGALREVLEETGVVCVPGAALPTVRYLAKGRPKEVDYWAAEAAGVAEAADGAADAAFVPNDEVDLLAWLPPDAARERLTHDHDRVLVDAFLDTLRSRTAPRPGGAE
ncbi:MULTISPECIES: NUDIX hydrolase [Streptomyces]|uniref:NUDIX hydrolase n=1 Tax=Streptomyces lonegramiae TaxID=3075524 RepID=A0ABU2XF46_9ACTN|nr:NUDIX hydrolase [Streptomyces sp. DSM 41529]MDT0544121.1 NUDIX hydrolase [Streptomyces sp. DSM 41529]